MGRSDDGDDPAPLTQTGSPRARVHGADQDIVALVVPSGASVEAQFDLINMPASDRADPVKLIGSLDGSSAQRWGVGRRELRGACVSARDSETVLGGVRTP